MGPPFTALIDNFNRADSGTAGGNWTTPYNTSLTSISILSNQCRGGGTGTSDGAQGSYSGDVEVWVTATDVSDNRGVSCHRSGASTTNTNGYLWQWEPSAPLGMYLYREDSNNFTQIGFFSRALSAGEKIMIRTVSGQVEGWVFGSGAWTRLVSVADASYRKGAIGLRLRGTAAQFDDFGGGLSPVMLATAFGGFSGTGWS